MSKSDNSHPESCEDDDCQLTYRQHLLSVRVSCAALPSRTDDDTLATMVREKRWERDMKAYKNLRADGLEPPGIDGSALRERQGQDEYDVEHRPVTIDYADAS